MGLHTCCSMHIPPERTIHCIICGGHAGIRDTFAGATHRQNVLLARGWARGGGGSIQCLWLGSPPPPSPKRAQWTGGPKILPRLTPRPRR